MPPTPTRYTHLKLALYNLKLELLFLKDSGSLVTRQPLIAELQFSLGPKSPYIRPGIDISITLVSAETERG